MVTNKGKSRSVCVTASALMCVFVAQCYATQLKPREPTFAVLPAQRQRPYRLIDSLNRRQMGEVEVSPDGAVVAVCLGRPVGPGESYVPETLSLGLAFLSTRSDLLVISVHDGRILWRSTDGPGTTAVYPRWSPNGKSLAFVLRNASGQVRLKLWSRAYRVVYASIPVAIDFTVPMRSDSAPSQAAAPFAWVDDDQVVVVSRGQGDVVADPYGNSRLTALGSLWRGARLGEASYALSSSDVRPLCRVSDVLLELTLARRPYRSVLAEGPIKGVSVSSDGSVAYVLAVQRGPLPPNAALQFPPMRNYFDFDQFALWRVLVVRPGQEKDPPVTVLKRGEGPVSGETLPIWSLDSRRLSGVLRYVETDGRVRDMAYGWTRGEAEATRIATRSFQSARSTAFAYVADRRCYSRGMRGGVKQPKPSKLRRSAGKVDQDERAASIGDGWLCVRDGDTRIEVPADAQILGVYGPWYRESVVFAKGNGEIGYRVVHGATLKARWSVPRGRARVVGLDGHDDLISASDESSGSYLCRGQQRGPPRCLLAVNTYLSSVLRSSTVGITYVANGAPRHGVLMFPTWSATARPPPVIVMAYPQLTPLDSSGGIGVAINTQASQYTAPFAADGYAVFVVDFRLPNPLPSSVSAKDNVLSEVRPAMNALEKVAAVDGRRRGFWGFSYGGYTALTMLAYTHSFRAIVAMSPLGDLAQYSYADWPEAEFTRCWADVTFTIEREVEGAGGGEHKYAFIRMGAPQYRVPWKYEENSPSLHMGNATTPTLVGAGDLDAFANGAEPTYLALTRLGVPAEFVKFYGEGHILVSPGNIRAQCALTLRWFDKYVKRVRDAERIKEICGTVASGADP